jgi:hypothetical protein
MTTDGKLNRLHTWIHTCGTFTVRELVTELDGLRKYGDGKLYEGLPTNGIEAQELLLKLEAEGRAVRDGTFWRWAEGRKEAKQAVLF